MCMVAVLWASFPRLLEDNINGLLDRAPPNALKAYQIYRTLKNEGLWKEPIEVFTRRLDDFFSRPRAERRKCHFDAFLDRPMDHDTYTRFHLDFRTAAVDEKSLVDLASWAHNIIRVSKNTSGAFSSLDVMIKTLRRITEPTEAQKAENIEFNDFCNAWRSTVFNLYGRKHDREFFAILNELDGIYEESKKAARDQLAALPAIYLTHTETEWTKDVRRAAVDYAAIPKFPLSRGPQKALLIELNRIISLYTITQMTEQPEIVSHMENIRATILDRCDVLLGAKEKNRAA